MKAILVFAVIYVVAIQGEVSNPPKNLFQNPFLPTVHFIEVKENTFSPMALFVHVGDRVQWNWAQLSSPQNIVGVAEEGAKSFIGKSGNVSQSGNFYWYPVRIGTFSYISEVSKLGCIIFEGKSRSTGADICWDPR